MAERPAVDASPLIILSHAGHLDLLQLVAPELVVPQPVADEIQRRGPGESSVLGWCYEHGGAEAIIDDLPARRCAHAFGIPVRGTLGLVLSGKRRGRYPSARDVLQKMRRTGMYLSDQVLDRALKSVGE